jgi:hypothetical protein
VITCVKQDLNLTGSSSLGRQLEIQAAFVPTSGSQQQQLFSVGVQLITGNGTFTSILVNGTAAASADGTITLGQVCSAAAISSVAALTFLARYMAPCMLTMPCPACCLS